MSRPKFIEVEGHSLKVSNIVRVSDESSTITIGGVSHSDPVPELYILDVIFSSIFSSASELVSWIDDPNGAKRKRKRKQFLEEQGRLKRQAYENGSGSWMGDDGVSYTLIPKYVVIMRGSRPVHLYEKASYEKVKEALT